MCEPYQRGDRENTRMSRTNGVVTTLGLRVCPVETFVSLLVSVHASERLKSPPTVPSSVGVHPWIMYQRFHSSLNQGLWSPIMTGTVLHHTQGLVSFLVFVLRPGYLLRRLRKGCGRRSFTPRLLRIPRGFSFGKRIIILQ